MRSLYGFAQFLWARDDPAAALLHIATALQLPAPDTGSRRKLLALQRACQSRQTSKAAEVVVACAGGVRTSQTERVAPPPSGDASSRGSKRGKGSRMLDRLMSRNSAADGGDGDVEEPVMAPAAEEQLSKSPHQHRWVDSQVRTSMAAQPRPAPVIGARTSGAPVRAASTSDLIFEDEYMNL